MAPPLRTAKPRRAEADDAAHVLNAHMAFSMSLNMAYQRATVASKPRHPRPHTHSKQPAAAKPRAPSAAKTIEQPVARIHQLPKLPAGVACDATHPRLSAEAQLVQDHARDSYKARISNLSDCESLRCLESFPLHITIRPALADRPTARKSYAPPILPKYFPSLPRKLRSPCFDQDAPQTTQSTNSSKGPLKPIHEDGNSFSDDFELFRDDHFFRYQRQEVGDLLPVGGISLFAQLEDIRAREANGSRGPCSESSSFPGVLSDGTTDSVVDEVAKFLVPAQNRYEEDIEQWQHVEDSAVLSREIAEKKKQQQQQQQQTVDTDFTEWNDFGDEIDANSVTVEDGVGAPSMSESGIVERHTDTSAQADAMYDSMSEGKGAIDTLAIDEGLGDAVVVDMDQAAKKRVITDDNLLIQGTHVKDTGSSEVIAREQHGEHASYVEAWEEEDDWLQVENPEDVLNDDDI